MNRWVIRLAKQKKNSASQKEYPQLDLIQRTVTQCLVGKVPPGSLQEGAYQALNDKDLARHLERTIANKRLSYRDLAIVQAAYAICQPGLDTTVRPEGARTVSQRLSLFLKANHIKAVEDAYQNVGKNTDKLVREADADSDALLTWMASAKTSEIEAVFNYMCAWLAASARAILPLPEIDATMLTFGAVTRLVDALLGRPSGGAYEQFSVAALLEALVQQTSDGLRVETKHLNATDKSSATAGDVELRLGGRVIEAFEVTAKSWETKIDGAVRKVREHDLRRFHIIARVPETDKDSLAQSLAALPVDVSVIDVSNFNQTCIAALDKVHRRIALMRLYELLDRKQDSVECVNQYVATLEDHGLTISPS